MAGKLYPLNDFNDQSELLMFISSLQTVINELNIKVAQLEAEIASLKKSS